MWEWLLKEINSIVKSLPFTLKGLERDDIVGIVCLYFCQNEKLAKDIYDNKKSAYLYKIVRREIYNEKSKLHFQGKMELSRYQRIIAVCEAYNISPTPENSYKINLLMGDNPNFSIAIIKNLLARGKRSEESLDGKEYLQRLL